MSAIFRSIDFLFDSMFRLLRGLPPLLILAILAVASAVFTLIVFRWTSNQKAIRKAKDHIGAHVLEIRLFPDQLGVVARAYFALLGSLLTYLRHSLRPVLVLFVPLLILFVQLEAYFEHTPIPGGRDFLVRASLAEGRDLNGVELALPPGIQLTAPAVHIAPDREVDWRLRAEKTGNFDIRIGCDGAEYTKRIVVGSRLERINSERRRGGMWEWLISQGEPPLPESGPLEKIEVQYPARSIAVWRWGFNWILPFLVLMLIAALALKDVLRTEF